MEAFFHFSQKNVFKLKTHNFIKIEGKCYKNMCCPNMVKSHHNRAFKDHSRMLTNFQISILAGTYYSNNKITLNLHFNSLFMINFEYYSKCV